MECTDDCKRKTMQEDCDVLIEEKDRRIIELEIALRAQPEDPRGCTCKSMTAYNCPFHLRYNALKKGR
jgi:hypothetical protein